MCQESLQQKVQALQHLETETIGKRNYLRGEAAPAKGIVKTEMCVLSPYKVFHPVTLLFSSKDKAWMLWMSLTYVLDWVPNSFLPLPVLLVFGNICLLRRQISRCHAYPGHVSVSALQINVQIYVLKTM